MYPALEIQWERHHDPELQIRDCHGVPPSEQSASEVIKSLSLAHFGHLQVHQVLQCNDIHPLRWDQPEPMVQKGTPECEDLQDTSYSLLAKLAPGFLALGLLLVWCWRGCPLQRLVGWTPVARSRKVKREDSRTGVIGAAREVEIEL
mmetsp:Transcript_68822/g.201553  ORF Transcript_68822/g.201553 Transcript_68822/m.201553 type:complete len:147 (-) Transcript_68822:71-511(-)